MAKISKRKRIWGWYFFDWASQPYNTLLLTFIFGPYFAQTATSSLVEGGMALSQAKAQAQAYWGYGLTATGLAIAVLAPILGAVADSSGRRMPWIWLFSALYVDGTARFLGCLGAVLFWYRFDRHGICDDLYEFISS